MKVVAICVSCGRASLSELLGCWLRQTLPLPLLVWLDDAPHVRVWDVPPHFHVVHAPRLGGACDVGAARNAAVAHARERFQLDDDDAFLTLDDDDHWSPTHAEVTARVLALGAEWTGARLFGVQPGNEPPRLQESDGPGPHSAWGMRFGLFAAHGGYPLGPAEDTRLADRIGWARCTPHWHFTHVRRIEHGANLSAHACNRELARAHSTLTPVAHVYESRYARNARADFHPVVSDAMVKLDAWMTERRHFAERVWRKPRAAELAP